MIEYPFTLSSEKVVKCKQVHNYFEFELGFYPYYIALILMAPLTASQTCSFWWIVGASWTSFCWNQLTHTFSTQIFVESKPASSSEDEDGTDEPGDTMASSVLSVKDHEFEQLLVSSFACAAAVFENGSSAVPGVGAGNDGALQSNSAKVGDEDLMEEERSKHAAVRCVLDSAVNTKIYIYCCLQLPVFSNCNSAFWFTGQTFI